MDEGGIWDEVPINDDGRDTWLQQSPLGFAEDSEGSPIEVWGKDASSLFYVWQGYLSKREQ